MSATGYKSSPQHLKQLHLDLLIVEQIQNAIVLKTFNIDRSFLNSKLIITWLQPVIKNNCLLAPIWSIRPKFICALLFDPALNFISLHVLLLSVTFLRMIKHQVSSSLLCFRMIWGFQSSEIGLTAVWTILQVVCSIRVFF